MFVAIWPTFGQGTQNGPPPPVHEGGHSDVAVAAATILLFFATCASIIVTWIIWRGQRDAADAAEERQRKFSEVMEERHREFLAAAAEKDRQFSQDTADRAMLLSQRTNLVHIWEYLTRSSAINPNDIVVPDVIYAINVLGLIGLCYEGRIIDKKLILRTFRKTALRLAEQIERCGPLPGLEPLTGKDLLKENLPAMKLIRILRKAEEDRDSLDDENDDEEN